MGLAASDRQALLSSWIEPSSISEAERQERAERMVKSAIDAHRPFANVSISVYAKGSYANNTNVRIDSDVDIVVQCSECRYCDYATGVTPAAATSYTGPWNPVTWRREVASALTSYFGTEVDTSGKVAIRIPERPGSRPSTDVVPSFQYAFCWDTAQITKAEGSVVYPTTGPRIINWAQQQLDNGRARNVTTGQRYKRFVRALKNCENLLVKSGVLKELPSYFMECLIWNVADAKLTEGTLDAGFRATLLDLWVGLDGPTHHGWMEPNRLKRLFDGGQKWTPADAVNLVNSAWNLLYV